MRKINDKLRSAWNSFQSIKTGNSEVISDPEKRQRVMVLHGNTIAKDIDGSFQINHCGWMTSTTLSRFREALSLDIRVMDKNYFWVYHSEIGSSILIVKGTGWIAIR